VDLLCIDDVHFLAGKDKTQAELLHTIDALDLSGARLVLCSDEHPKRVRKFNQRLVSRCVQQMVVGVEPPDRDLRVALAKRLAARCAIVLDEEAAVAIAERFTASARDIEGGVRRLQLMLNAHGSVPGVRIDEVGGRHVSAAAVRAVLGAAPLSGGRKPVPVTLISEVVCEHLGIELADLYGDGRHRLVVLARSVSAVLARSLTSQSFPEIARAMNRRNHSTIITAHQRGTKMIEESEVRDAGPRLGEMQVDRLVALLRDEIVRRCT
jgi:chromosomal replication initiator protein